MTSSHLIQPLSSKLSILVWHEYSPINKDIMITLLVQLATWHHKYFKDISVVEVMCGVVGLLCVCCLLSLILLRKLGRVIPSRLFRDRNCILNNLIGQEWVAKPKNYWAKCFKNIMKTEFQCKKSPKMNGLHLLLLSR